MKSTIVALFIWAIFVQGKTHAGTIPGSRIIDGELVPEGTFSWNVAMSIEKPEGGSICGGSLIHPNYILTAAHCVLDSKNITMNFGTINFNKGKESRVATKFIAHEHYNYTNNDNDIAIVYIDNPVEETDQIRIIALPKKGDRLGVDVDVIANGYGMTENGEYYDLRYVWMRTISNEECAKRFDISERHLCCQGAGIQSICVGDSGSPLILWDSNRIIQVGINSFVSGGGCTIGAPAGFVRTESYLDWISEVTNNAV